ncbi:hypothetical protein C0993_009053 [Termitomyces sp. T159_Od127]|nr:hypothetical protein C0993_009053 [Termitomyces sp. T159_Od127]
MADIYAASELRKKFTHFRILVIGRANAGKTTILKRVCNTTEDPRFYDEENNALVYDSALDENDNCQVAQDKLDKLKAPLFHEYLFPPKAGVCLEDMHLDEGKHQEYVKKLIKETVESLDSLALKMLLNYA